MRPWTNMQSSNLPHNSKFLERKSPWWIFYVQERFGIRWIAILARVSQLLSLHICYDHLHSRRSHVVNDLRQFPHGTEVEFSARVNTIAYRCGNAFMLNNEISTFTFSLQSAIQTSVAHKIKELQTRDELLKVLFKKLEKEAKPIAHVSLNPSQLVRPCMIVSVNKRTKTKRLWCTETEEAVNFRVPRKK